MTKVDMMFYDLSLSSLLQELVRLFGEEEAQRAVVVRDAGGRLSVVLSISVNAEVLADAAQSLSKILGPYARPDRVIADRDSPGASRLLREAADRFPTVVGNFLIRVLDRRIVGSDWQRAPEPTSLGVPRFVFASLKGGVGRSTALCVLAAHLSRKGHRVLAIDFDLEAPGIGTMLLDETSLPRFGALDYLVESSLSNVDDEFMANLSGDSYLGSEGARVTVIPAIGTETLNNPANALGKISRAYVESIDDLGGVKSIGGKLQSLIAWYEGKKSYDVILVDARAGLHETTAGAILGLGGETFLFGVDQPQTFLGYRLLMSHLAQFPINADDDWRSGLHFVHAKAPDDILEQLDAESRFLELFNLLGNGYSSNINSANDASVDLTEKDFDLEWKVDIDDDVEETRDSIILRVLDDSRYAKFDPISQRALLSSNTYLTTFDSLLKYVDELMYDINLFGGFYERAN